MPWHNRVILHAPGASFLCLLWNLKPDMRSLPPWETARRWSWSQSSAQPNWGWIRLISPRLFPDSPPSPSSHSFVSRLVFGHLLAYSCPQGDLSFLTPFQIVTLQHGHGHSFYFIFFILCMREKKKKTEKRKDGCKHSWLLKGEIYSWVIKVYDWIPSVIGCSEPRGTRSMNMNFMLLSIPWSFPCISSRLRYSLLKRLFSSL